jgi:NADPH2:quinone reductase
MRVIHLNEHGGPEVLVPAKVAAPVAGPGELLVQTHAIGLNFIETYQRAGIYPTSLPATLGEEASGTVMAIGRGVAGFAPGDRVTTAEGRATYAEQFTVAAEGAAHVPDGVSLDIAAALPLQGLTAHYLANSSAHPEAGETVLVHAGAGGVGLLLTQLLVARGVRVLTTAGGPGKAALSLAAGADQVLDYDSFSVRAREITGGCGVSVVYDGVGRDTFDASLHALQVRGTLVLFGAASGQVPPVDPQRLNAGGSLSLTRPTLTHFLQNAEERAWRYRELFEAVENGTLDVRIGARFALADAGLAHAALEGRRTTGKVLLDPNV